MKKDIIKLDFEEDKDTVILEIPKEVLRKINVDKDRPYVKINSDYGLSIKRVIIDEEELYDRKHELVDKYYKDKRLSEEEVKELFNILRELDFIGLDYKLITKDIENEELLTIETDKETLEITWDYDVNR